MIFVCYLLCVSGGIGVGLGTGSDVLGGATFSFAAAIVAIVHHCTDKIVDAIRSDVNNIISVLVRMK